MNQHQPDQIGIDGLRVSTHIGVPDEERSALQTLEIDLCLEPADGFSVGSDEILGTVDYYAVSLRVREVAAERPRKLIETLAEDIASVLLEEYGLVRVDVLVRKFILPDTKSVSVRISRVKTG